MSRAKPGWLSGLSDENDDLSGLDFAAGTARIPVAFHLREGVSLDNYESLKDSLVATFCLNPFQFLYEVNDEE